MDSEDRNALVSLVSFKAVAGIADNADEADDDDDEGFFSSVKRGVYGQPSPPCELYNVYLSHASFNEPTSSLASSRYELVRKDSIPSSSSGFSSRGSGAIAEAIKCRSGVCSGAACSALMADSMSSNASTASTAADHEERERAKGDTGGGDKGVENKAFVKEEEQEEDHSESRSTGSSSGGSSGKKSPPHDDVNLELVDLTPPGQPKIMSAKEKGEKESLSGGEKTKKGSSGGDCFIQVNEHKKGIRSEKLYVTKSNRDEEKSSKCGKYFCIFLGLVVILGGIAVAILVGVGIIDPAPSPITSNSSGSSAPPSAGPRISGIFHQDSPSTNLLDSEDVYSSPSAGEVDGAFEGRFRISSETWNDALSDQGSPMYRAMSARILEELKKIYSDDDLNVTIFGFEAGSVIVKFRISGSGELSRAFVFEKLMQALQENDMRLSSAYEVDEPSVVVHSIADVCHVECPDGSTCFFDYNVNAFACNAIIVAAGTDGSVVEDEIEKEASSEWPIADLPSTTANLNMHTSEKAAGEEEELSTSTLSTSTLSTSTLSTSTSGQDFDITNEPTERAEVSTEDVVSGPPLTTTSEETGIVPAPAEEEKLAIVETFPESGRQDDDLSEDAVTIAMPESSTVSTTSIMAETTSTAADHSEANPSMLPERGDNSTEVLMSVEETTQKQNFEVEQSPAPYGSDVVPDAGATDSETNIATEVSEVRLESTTFSTSNETNTEKERQMSNRGNVTVAGFVPVETEEPLTTNDSVENVTTASPITNPSVLDFVQSLNGETTQEIISAKESVTRAPENDLTTVAEPGFVITTSSAKIEQPEQPDVSTLPSLIEVAAGSESSTAIVEGVTQGFESFETEGEAVTQEAQTAEITTRLSKVLSTTIQSITESILRDGNLTEDNATKFEDALTKVLTEISTSTSTTSSTEPAITSDEGASSVDLSIPIIKDPVEVQQKLQELVANVTKQFKITTLAYDDESAAVTESSISSGLNEAVTMLVPGFVSTVATTEEPAPSTAKAGASGKGAVEGENFANETDNAAVPRNLQLDESEVLHNALVTEPTYTLENECTTLGMFSCGNGCIRGERRCDLITDCEDGSDEMDCESNVCPETQWRCPTGHCIPADSLCDLKNDCPGAEDERGCTTDDGEGNGGCPEAHFPCVTEGRCLPAGMRCDGEWQCSTGEDEAGCGEDACDGGRFKCRLGGGCVEATRVCDGFADCADHSDEARCAEITGDDVLTIRYDGADTKAAICADDWSIEWSSLACHQLGYPRPMSDGVASSAATQLPIVRLNTSSVSNSLQAAVYPAGEADVCSKGAVAIGCHPAECGRLDMPEELLNRLLRSEEDDSDVQWPTVAYIFNVDAKESCTVSILSPRWLLGSLRCVQRISMEPLKWVVFAGPAGPSDSSEDGLQREAQTVLISRLEAPPSSRHEASGFIAQDAVLIETATPLKFTDKVKGICLPPVPGADVGEGIKEGQFCVTAGWEKMNGGVGVVQYLEYLAEPSLGVNDCNSTEHYNGLLHNNFICAGGRQARTTCKSDFGAPLMCSDNGGVWQLYGVLSREGECEDPQSTAITRAHPDVFTDIQALRPWIEQVAGEFSRERVA